MIFLIVFLIYQNMLSVQSFQNDNSELKEMQKYIETSLASVEELTTQTARAMYGLSSSYVREGLADVNQLLNISPSDALTSAHEKLFKEVNKCIDDVDTNIHTAITKFSEIEEKALLFLDVIDKMGKESINSGTYDSIDHLRQHYKSTVDPYVTELLTQLKYDSFSVPLNVKKCVESLTIIVPLILKSETQYSGLVSDIERSWVHFADEKKILSTKIDKECSFYILEGLKKVKELSTQSENYGEISSTITECRNEGIEFLKAADAKFTEILEESRRVAEKSFKDIQMHSLTLDDMSEQHDDSMVYFKSQLDSTTTSALKVFLKELRQDSISVPKKVKKCVDEAIYLLWVSSVKSEL